MNTTYSNAQWNQIDLILGESDIDPSQPVNLLIGFHGAESTPENMLMHGNQLQVGNAIHVYPKAPVDAGKGLWSWWKDFPNQKETVAEFLVHTRNLIDEAHSFVNAKYNGASSRLCLWGFSQGAAAALVYGHLGHHPVHRIASVCGFLPELPESPANGHAFKLLGIFGLNDEVVPSFLAEFALEEMGNHGHETEIKETSQGHEVTPDNIQLINRFFNA